MSGSFSLPTNENPNLKTAPNPRPARHAKDTVMIIVVRKCSDCPFCSQGEPARCNLSTPKHRPLDPAQDRPSWCPLRREQAIVREAS